MTVEETRAQLEVAKAALDEAKALFAQAGEAFKVAGTAIVACGEGSSHSEPGEAGGGLQQAAGSTDAAVTYAQATNDTIDNYAQSI